MELAHGLLLNEEALKLVGENKRGVFVYEWLRFLQKVLKASQKSDIKEKQDKLIEQLTNQILDGPGPPTRALIGHCLSALYKIGDSFGIYDAVCKCQDIIKSKDDSPSYLSVRLAAIVVIGILYEHNGRMLGGLFTDTVQVLVKGLKNAESQTRSETLTALKCLLIGLGSSATMCHRDIYKVAKHLLADRSTFVRSSAAECLEELIKEAGFVYSNEFEPLMQQCVRALEGSTYETRCAVARLIGTFVAGSQRTKPTPDLVAKGKKPSLEEVLNSLSNGFLNAGSTGGARDLLKGNSSRKNIRIGISEAFVEFVRELGSDWLQKNISTFLNKVLEMVAQPKASVSHVDAVYSRRCITFILRSTLGAMLGEPQQQVAVLELCRIISKQTSYLDANVSDNSNQEILSSQHVLVCATQEVGSLMRGLSTAALPLVVEAQNSIVDPILAVLLYPSHAARLSAAWCLRCIAVALPSQLSIMIDRCAEKIKTLKSSGEAISGYSAAIASLLGAARECPMGIPYDKGKMIFKLAEDMLRSVGQNSRLSLFRTQGGWLMIGSLLTLGSTFARPHLPKLLLLWKTSFPRSMRELDQERQRGDAFSWQLTLESRSGALCAMRSFVAHCGDILTEELTRKLMVPLESALAMMAILPQIISLYGPHLKAGAAMVRLRLYDILALLSPTSYEGCFNALLRELVAEFTLTDNQANTTTSLLHSLCHHDDNVLLGTWLKESDQSLIENQLQSHSGSGSGSIEHDPTTVYLQYYEENVAPGPLPLGISVIDAAIALFGLAFPHVAMKHRLQMLNHFDECVKQASKNAQRQKAIQINVFTALICALKGLAESKRHLGGDDVQVAATSLIITALTSTDATLRCAAGEAVGRMTQVTSDNNFLSKTAQLCFEKLKTARDVISRTGHSFALGCLHRYVGGMGSGQHLRMSVGILLALSQDSNSPEVQVWALHALSLIIDAFGPMFRSFVEPALQVVLTLFLQVAPHHIQVHRCLGRCLSALVTTIGPEMQVTSSTISGIRSSCLTSCAIMSHHADAQVQAESVGCLQQLHMFAPRHVEVASLVPRLCRYLSSWHLILRRASVSCLRQLAQKEALEVCQIASTNTQDDDVNKRGVVITDSVHNLNFLKSYLKFKLSPTGLEGALFSLLDREMNTKLASDIRDTINHILQDLAMKNLRFWLTLCKSVLAASTDNTALSKIEHEQQETNEDKDENDDDIFTANKEKKKENVIQPRWPTRVFAIELVRRIISMCHSSSDEAHFNLEQARNVVRNEGTGDYLVIHLSDLVRMSFMASTDNSVQLKMAGLEALQDVIKYFKDVPEPEFQGSVILEQYQANVGAALRPAFLSSDTSGEIMVKACEVCSAWITSLVVRDLSDLKRVTTLLVSSLDMVKQGTEGKETYSESASTMIKLAVLSAWSKVCISITPFISKNTHISPKQIYIAAMHPDPSIDPTGVVEQNMLTLVQPHLDVLSQHWVAVVKDQAILRLPPEFHSHLPEQGGNFFTIESMSSVRGHYATAWPTILHALSLWLAHVDFASDDDDVKSEENNTKLHLALGVCVEALCSPRTSDSISVILSCLSTLDSLFSSEWTRKKINEDHLISVELLNVLHRLLLTRDSHTTQQIVLRIAKKVISGAIQYKNKENHCFNQGDADSEVSQGEGGKNGSIEAGRSLVFASLEICMCVLVRKMPSVNPTFRNTSSDYQPKRGPLPTEGATLVSTALNLLTDILDLCSPRGCLTILPTILFLLTGVLRESVTCYDGSICSVSATTSALQSLRKLLTSDHIKSGKYCNEWIQLLQSSLLTILDFADDDSLNHDPVSMVTTISLFILTAPPSVVDEPQINRKIVNFFQNKLSSSDPKIELKTLSLISPIFRHNDPNISSFFIQHLAPSIITKLQHPDQISSSRLSVATECMNVMELLVSTSNQHKTAVVGMVVPILISCLTETTTSTTTQHRVSLHDSALKKLLQIGLAYPEPFKSSLETVPGFKARLENAIRKNQNDAQQARERAVVKNSAASATNKPSQPSIKLKMDFSNFGKK
uniref:HEAT repeat-containing protein 5B n=1 Tax=Ciona intestinalis TaxID=7719 RepID=H2Y0W9_CIOIN